MLYFNTNQLILKIIDKKLFFMLKIYKKTMPVR